MKKYLLMVGIIILATLLLFGGRSAEKTAKQAIEALYEKDINKYISLCSDELIELEMERFDAETIKILVRKYEKFFEAEIEGLKERLGKKWKYKIEIIDVYDYAFEKNSEYFALYEGEEVVEVSYEIVFTGKRFLKKVEDVETGKMRLVKRGKNWYVAV